jgi:hypothetical protein
VCFFFFFNFDFVTKSYLQFIFKKENFLFSILDLIKKKIQFEFVIKKLTYTTNFGYEDLVFELERERGKALPKLIVGHWPI